MEKGILLFFGVMVSLMLSSCDMEPLHIGGGESSGGNGDTWITTNLATNEVSLFVTEVSHALELSTKSGGKPSVETIDRFVAVAGITSSTGVSVNDSEPTYSASGYISPAHVGRTEMHISNSRHDTMFIINVLPEWYTYKEPAIDFDDTFDSIKIKLHNYNYSPSDTTWIHVNETTPYYIRLQFATDGKVDSYCVCLDDSIDGDELEGFLKERYYKTSAVRDGMSVYVKAFNVTSPSISDATVIVMLDKAGRKVYYQNPLTY